MRARVRVRARRPSGGTYPVELGELPVALVEVGGDALLDLLWGFVLRLQHAELATLLFRCIADFNDMVS